MGAFSLVSLVTIVFFVGAPVTQVEAARNFEAPTNQPNRIVNYSFFSGTTTSATSTNTTDGGGSFLIAGAKYVNLYFSRAFGGGNSGSTQFRIQVTPNGTDWYDYNALILDGITPGNVDRAIVGTSTISAATTTIRAKMEDLGFYAIRCIALETTDGSHTCAAEAEF